MELILLRHAATEGNLLRQYIGRTDLPLAEEGLAQAGRLCGCLPEPELLFVSPLLRCRQTAEVIWPGVEQRIVPDLRETDFGAFEGKTWEELKDNPTYRAWIDGTAECPQGEERAAVSRRIHTAMEDCMRLAAERNCTLCAMVVHGGTIMELLHRSLGGAYYDWQTPLCGSWRVCVGESGRILSAERNTGF